MPGASCPDCEKGLVAGGECAIMAMSFTEISGD